MAADAVRRALAFLASAYPARAKELAAPETHAAWCLALGDVPEDVLRLASARLARTGDWPPPASAIRREALALAGYRPPTPMEAFAEMERERSACRFRPPRYSHPAVEEAVRVFGGLEAISESWLVNDHAANRARFAEAYQLALERHEHELYALPWPEAVGAVREKILLGLDRPPTSSIIQPSAGSLLGPVPDNAREAQ